MLSLKTALLGAALTVVAVGTASADPLRVRGTITAIDGDTVTVENAAGQSVDVALQDPVVLLYRDIPLSDVPDNAYVAIPSIAAGDGERRALGLVVFPEAMRGTDEGFKDWDLTPESGMTNASVARITSRGGENILTVTFGGEEQTVYVPPTAPITTFAPAPDLSVETGLNVVIFADDAGGALSGRFIGIHENGSLPPL